MGTTIAVHRWSWMSAGEMIPGFLDFATDSRIKRRKPDVAAPYHFSATSSSLPNFGHSSVSSSAAEGVWHPLPSPYAADLLPVR